jgi:hypothetical protein
MTRVRLCRCFVRPSDRNDFKEACAARTAEEARVVEEAANAAGAQAKEEENFGPHAVW